VHAGYSRHYRKSRTCAKLFTQYHDCDPTNWPADEASIVAKVHDQQIIANLTNLRNQDPTSFDKWAGTLLPDGFSLNVVQDGPTNLPVVSHVSEGSQAPEESESEISESESHEDDSDTEELSFEDLE